MKTIFRDDQGDWCWHLLAGDNARIALAGTRYKTQQECLAAVAQVKQSVDSRIMIREGPEGSPAMALATGL